MNEVTRAVIVPLPVSGWRAKEKLSVTTSPPGPYGTCGTQALPVFTGPPLIWHAMPALAAVNTPRKMVSSPARIMPITQPRTLRNLIHSARTREPKPPRGLAAAPGLGPRDGRGGHRGTSCPVLVPAASASKPAGRNSTACRVSSM